MNHHTISQYLEIEYDSSEKHEFDAGRIWAMSGGTYHHGLICGNTHSAIKNETERQGLGCITLGTEVRIHIKTAEAVVYPDAMVVCGKVAFSEEDQEAVINPKVVVEVLSKSTSGYDRGQKFSKYRQLPSFQEYILIEQDMPYVESFFREDNNSWKISNVRNLEGSLFIESLQIFIPLADIYAHPTHRPTSATNQN